MLRQFTVSIITNPTNNMEKVFKTTLILVVAAAILLFSCHKDTNSQITTATTQVRKENPFAFVGQFHNEGLDEIDRIKQTSNGLSPRIVFDAAKAFMAQKGYQTNLNFEDVSKRIADDSGNVITDHKALFAKLKQAERGVVSLRSVNRLDVVESFLETLEQQSDLQTALAYISTFEDGVETGYYSDEEKQYFQMVTATASSSLQYWSQNYDGYDVAGNGNQPVLRGRCGFWCWMCVAFWDVIGAAIGAGSTLTPTGAVVGGVVLSAAARCCPRFCTRDGCATWIICSFQ